MTRDKKQRLPSVASTYFCFSEVSLISTHFRSYFKSQKWLEIFFSMLVSSSAPFVRKLSRTNHILAFTWLKNTDSQKSNSQLLQKLLRHRHLPRDFNVPFASWRTPGSPTPMSMSTRSTVKKLEPWTGTCARNARLSVPLPITWSATSSRLILFEEERKKLKN